jgi:hypothetical protein
MPKLALRTAAHAHREKPLPEIYPGVVARVERFTGHAVQTPFGYAWKPDHPWGRITFEGPEAALRSAGFIRWGDELPQKPGGARGFASMKRNGDLRLRWHDGDEPAARDLAFARFMEAAIAGLDSDDGMEEESDDDWPMT